MKFDDTEIEEYKLHQYKSLVLIKYINNNKMLVSNKFPFGKQDFKYFIGYKHSEQIRPVCIFCPQIVYIKDISMKIYIFIF